MAGHLWPKLVALPTDRARRDLFLLVLNPHPRYLNPEQFATCEGCFPVSPTPIGVPDFNSKPVGSSLGVG